MEIKLTKKTVKRLNNGRFKPSVLRYMFMGSSIKDLLIDMQARDQVGFKKFEKLMEEVSKPIIDDRIYEVVKVLEGAEPTSKDKTTRTFTVPDTLDFKPYIQYMEKISGAIDDSINLLTVSLKHIKDTNPDDETISNVEEEIETFDHLNKQIKDFLNELKAIIKMNESNPSS